LCCEQEIARNAQGTARSSGADPRIEQGSTRRKQDTARIHVNPERADGSQADITKKHAASTETNRAFEQENERETSGNKR